MCENHENTLKFEGTETLYFKVHEMVVLMLVIYYVSDLQNRTFGRCRKQQLQMMEDKHFNALYMEKYNCYQKTFLT